MLWHGKNFRGFLNKASQVLFNKTGTTLNSTNVQDAICEINSKLLHYQDYNITYSLNANEMKMMKIDSNFGHTPISIVAHGDMQCLIGTPALQGSLLYTRIFATYSISEKSVTIRVYYID